MSHIYVLEENDKKQQQLPMRNKSHFTLWVIRVILVFAVPIVI
jgi:hypothetical protein